MSDKKPIVLYNGKQQQLQYGDSVVERYVLSDNKLFNQKITHEFGQTWRTPLRQVVTLNAGENQVHGTCWCKGMIFGTTRTTPAKLIRFNNPDDLTDRDVYTWAADGFHDSAEAIFYSETNDKLYIVFTHATRTTVAEVDPDGALSSVDVISNTSYGTSSSPLWATPTHLFILVNAATCVLLKYDLTNFATAPATLTMTSGWGHALVYDGVNLYATGNPTPQGWISRIDPVAMTETTQAFAATDDTPTDDLIEIGDYVWVGLEDANEGHLLKIKKSDLSIQTITLAGTFETYSLCYDGKHLWTTSTDSPSILYRVDPETHEIYSHTLLTGENTVNEILTDGRRLFLFCWLSPAKVIRLSSPELTPVSPFLTSTSISDSVYSSSWNGVTTIAPSKNAVYDKMNTMPTLTGVETLTNKRNTKRVGTVASAAEPTINTDNVDYFSITAQAVDITSMTTNLSGTPTDDQELHISITGTAARAITWGTGFEASTVALPTTTVGTDRLDIEFTRNTVTNKWRCKQVW